MADNIQVDTLSLEVDVETHKSTTKLRNLTNQIDATYKSLLAANPELEKLQKTLGMSGSASKSSGAVGKIASSTADVTKNTEQIGNNIKKISVFASLGKFYFLMNYFKQAGLLLANMVTKGIDFNETLNLWQVAFRSNINEARTFVSTMNQAYGISETTLMKSEATFKNMLSSLGSISEAASTTISESLTEMAVDFASLYNVSLDDAMTKFQAVLSGQVRPIRSVSGYDITENTLSELYKTLGGTGTYRSLSETEKRLLRIYAVFQQMSKSGALGDMNKTLTSNANQVRIMESQFEEIGTWSGVIVSQWMQQSGILVTINSYLIVAKELIKGIAYQLGYSEPTFLDGIFETATDANDAVSELSGSLMGFDKFNVLSSASSSDVSISETLLEAISKYTSILDNVTNPAVEKANELIEQMGLNWVYTATLGDTVITGTKEQIDAYVASLSEADKTQVSIVKHLDTSKLNEVFSLLKSGLIILAGYLGVKGLSKINSSLGLTISNLGTLVSAFKKADLGMLSVKGTLQLTEAEIKATTKLMDQLSNVGIFLLITNVVDLIDNWKQMDNAQRAVKIGLASLGVALIVFSQLEKYAIIQNKALTFSMVAMKAVTAGLVAGGFAILIDAFSKLSNWDALTTLQKIGAALEAIGGLALIAAGAMSAFKIASTGGIAAVGIIAGLTAAAGALLSYKASLNSVSAFAVGGFPKNGQLFIANEAGPELVGNMGNRTAVANNNQITQGIEKAAYNGFSRAIAESGRSGARDITITIDGNSLSSNDLARAIAPALRAYMRNNGGSI